MAKDNAKNNTPSRTSSSRTIGVQLTADELAAIEAVQPALARRFPGIRFGPAARLRCLAMLGAQGLATEYEQVEQRVYEQLDALGEL